MHDWSETNFDWKGLNNAAYYIGNNLKKYGRINVMQIKEKFGEARIYCSFGWRDFHGITHPGYAFSQYPKWLWNINCSRVVLYFFKLLNYMVIPYHKWLYRQVYKKALTKWPHLALEILNGSDWHEYLMGLNYQFDVFHKENWSCRNEH